MRAYLYYFVHSLLNSILKLFRSTVLWIILLWLSFSMTLGVTVGVTMVVISTVLEITDEKDPVSGVEDPDGEEKNDDEKESDEEEGLFFNLSLKNDLDTVKKLCDSIAGILILGVTLLLIYTGVKNGINMFNMADINFLFTSPLKPQMNLLFRMLGMIISYLVIGVYMCVVMPASLVAMGMSFGQVFTVCAVYVMLLFGGQMLMLLTYMVGASVTGLKDKIRPTIYGIIMALVLLYLYFAKVRGMGFMEGLFPIFTPFWTNAIPFVGWLKGMVWGAMYHNTGLILLFFALSLLAVIAIFVIAIRYPADFYEDTFEYAEKMLEATQVQNNPNEMMKRRKDRGKFYHRGEIGHGKGASVFFFRSMYLRKRLSLFGIFNLDMLLDAVCFGAGGYLLRSKPLLAIILFLAITIFFEVIKNYGNPISLDIARPYIYLVPDTYFRKISFSLFGTCLSSLIDVLPAIIVGGILANVSIWQLIGCIVFYIGLNFFCGNTGLLIDLLLPDSIPDKLKSYVQITLKMLPTIPLIGFMALISRWNITIGIYVMGLVTFALGFVLLFISAKVIDRNK